MHGLRDFQFRDGLAMSTCECGYQVEHPSAVIASHLLRAHHDASFSATDEAVVAYQQRYYPEAPLPQIEYMDR